MADVSGSCLECGGTIEISAKQRFRDWCWTWSEGTSCPHCGALAVVDGPGLLPDDVRAQLLEKEPAALRVTKVSITLLAQLKSVFKLRPIDLLALKRQLPGILVT